MQNNIGEARRSYAMTREDGKFSQEDAAAYFGVSVSTYQKWEQGVGKSLKVETLCAMADLYGTSADYLLCRSDNPKFEKVRKMGRCERELVELCDRMQPEHKEILMANARAFAALSEKDEQYDGEALGVGAVDAVRHV